jgi:integrase
MFLLFRAFSGCFVQQIAPLLHHHLHQWGFLMASITKRGLKWRAQVRRNGKSASASFSTKAKAAAWAAQQEALVESREEFAGAGRTFADLLIRYRDEVSVKKRGARREKLWIAVMLRDPLASVVLDRLSAADLSAWRDRRLAAVSPATVNREMAILSNACHIAWREWGWLRDVPTSRVARPKAGEARSRRPTKEEIDRLIMVSGYRADAPPVTKTARVVAAFLLACETGLRAGEILGLNRENVHDRHVHLPRTKNGHPRDVPLTGGAKRIIAQVMAVAPENGGIFGLDSTILDALWRKIRDAAGIDNLHFHDSRREALTRLSQIFGVMELARISGHRDLRILQNVYYAPDVADLAKKLE